MFTVVIAEKDGAERRVTFTEAEVTIGRVPGNDVVLPKGNVSKRHSRIVLKDNRFIVVDLKSTNGTYVNGRKITSPLVVKEGDKIYVGDYILTLEGAPLLGAAEPPALLEISLHNEPPARAMLGRETIQQEKDDDDDELPPVLRGGGTLAQSSIPGAPAARAHGPEVEVEALVEDEHLLPAESELEVFEDRSSGEQAREPSSDVHAAKVFPPPIDHGRPEARPGLRVMADQAASEGLLGPIDAVLADPRVFHVVVERFDRIRADRGEGLVLLDKVSFDSPQALVAVAEEVLSQAGLPLGTPSYDVSLANGIQVVALLSAAASNGAVLSIRRRPADSESLAQLAERSVLTTELAEKLQRTLLEKRHIWLISPVGLDASSLFSSVLSAGPADERVALFERAPEVAVGERSALCLKLGTVPVTELLERVRAFRPHRLALYGLREEELSPVLDAFAHHADGNIAAYEARSAKEALAAFDRAVGADLTLRAAALLVELRRGEDGKARVQASYDIELDASGNLALKPS